jgi:allantoin racemase
VHITERLAASARAALAAGDALTAVTASQGPTVVRNAAQLHAAEQSALALAGEHVPAHDAVVLGISLDGAAPRLRARHPGLPVVGMTEAALLSACLRSERIGLLTLGASLLPLYRQRVEEIGLVSRVVAWEGPESGPAFAADAARVDAAVLGLLANACGRLRRAGAQSVVLAGAVLCGYAEVLAARCALPVFDGIACAVGLAQVQLALRRGELPSSDRLAGGRR